jgi:thioredoxin 1
MLGDKDRGRRARLQWLVCPAACPAVPFHPWVAACRRATLTGRGHNAPMLGAVVFAVVLAPQEPPVAPAATTAKVTVALRAEGPPAAGPRWSPKAAKVSLHADGASLTGSFGLGGDGLPAIGCRLGKSDGSAHYDQLWIDGDRDGKVGDGEQLVVKVSEQRGKWWSSTDTVVRIPVPGADGAAATRPYPIACWFVEDPFEPGAEPELRWTRRGWHEGECTIDGRPAVVMVAEATLDGRIDRQDAWSLGRDREATAAASFASLDHHCWLDGKAFRATAIDAQGGGITFESFDPGFTEAEERARNDSARVDRQAKRAPAPLVFGDDLATALRDAKAAGRRVFVDFQTTWCGPCRAMENDVYTAAAVVEAAASTIAVKLDGDVARELTKQYAVTGYPTMLLLDGDGKELKRLVGYQHVSDMVAFFAAPKPPRAR